MSNSWVSISSNALTFWHPVCKSSSIKDKPLAVTVCNEDVVLFRSSRGKVGALEDRCAHRGIRLSLGQVVGERIVCPYHSWSYDNEGCGCSPAEPEKKIKIKKYSVKEIAGYVWIRRDEPGDVEMPLLEFDGYELVHTLTHQVNAPFRLLMDNMAELEHTTTVHECFGFSLSRIQEVVTKVEVDSESDLKIYYEGPQRAVPAHVTMGTGIREGDRYVQYATIKFGPVHSTYDLIWHEGNSDKRRGFGLKFVIFYIPVTETICQQHAFVYVDRRFPSWRLAAIKPLLVRIVEKEILTDIHLVESLRVSDADASLHDLGRFDKPLAIARDFIRRKYFCLEE